MQKEMFVISEGDIASRCRAINKPGKYAILPHANRVNSYLESLRADHEHHPGRSTLPTPGDTRRSSHLSHHRQN